MIEVKTLNKETQETFLELVTGEGQKCLSGKDGFAFGADCDGASAGALALRIDEGTAYIVSLYVLPEYRRKGCATELLYSCCEFVENYEGIYTLRAKFSESGEEDTGLRKFFEQMDFEMTLDERHGAYCLHLADAAEAESLKIAPPDNIIRYKDVNSVIKNTLLMKHDHMRLFAMQNKIDTEMSCFISCDPEKNISPDCMIFGHEDDELIMLWAKSTDNKLNLLKLLKFALDEALKKYDLQQKIRIPYINSMSKKLIEKVLGDKAETAETVWDALLPIEGELEDLELDEYLSDMLDQ